jgi:hypothetical protein
MDEIIQSEKETPPVVKNTLNEQDTYLLLGNSEAGLQLEIDLVTYREKGERVKYLSVALTNGEGLITSLSLDKESFANMKAFFKQLEWDN